MNDISLNSIYQGDAKEVLTSFADKSVNCCITSPPYYGLRDYGVSGQIGLEQTPEQYIEKLTDVFMEVHRVLKDDGTLWVNIGDSYAGSGKGRTKDGAHSISDNKQNTNHGSIAGELHKSFSGNGIKPKDLIGIPWSLAFALRSAGWYLRQDIIWQKPNAMPESVRDRCTKAHEYIFMFSKRPKYYYDIDSIREPHKSIKDLERRIRNGKAEWKTDKASAGSQYAVNGTGRSRDTLYHPLGRNKRTVWTLITKQTKDAHFAVYPEELITDCVKAGCPEGGLILDPFMGSGTTGIVAMKHNRNYVGIELNPDYIQIAEKRLKR